MEGSGSGVGLLRVGNGDRWDGRELVSGDGWSGGVIEMVGVMISEGGGRREVLELLRVGGGDQ